MACSLPPLYHRCVRRPTGYVTGRQRSPIDLLNLAGTLKLRSLLARLTLRRRGECGLANHWRLAGLEKNDIVCHQGQDGFEVACFCRSRPRGKQLPYLPLIALLLDAQRCGSAPLNVWPLPPQPASTETARPLRLLPAALRPPS